MTSATLPISVNVASIGAEPKWWLDAARRLDAAGYRGIWCWDHFIGRGPREVPVVESWTALSAAAVATRRVQLGTFVANVMNRHPAVLARMVATLQAISGGRVQLGIGIGGHPAEHRAMGIPFPNAPERVDRLREAIEVLRALWTGDRVTRPSPYYPLEDAYALPRPQPTPPIIIGGETRGGARLAAELGDGWTVGSDKLHDLLPQYLESLQELGKVGQHHVVLVAFQGSEWLRRGESRLTPWCEQPFETLAEWRAFGADGVILTATSDTDITRLVRATDRW